MVWHHCIGIPPRWAQLRGELSEDDGESDLVIQITDNCDGETSVYWDDQGAALATWTPQRNVILSRMQPGQAERLAQHLRGQPLLGVSGHLPEVESFVATWTQAAGDQGKRLDQTLTLYDLPKPIPPKRCPGAARECKRSDLDHVHNWMKAFHRETDPSAPAPRRATIDRGLARGSYQYWVVDQRPVCLVGIRWISATTSRIAPVYTPPNDRQRGYASALVYEVAKRAVNAGRCTLLADQANPAANAVYQALGFRQRADFQVWKFEAIRKD